MTAPAPRNHPAEDAHLAPTPAPVAVPEEAVEVAARAYATLIGASEEEPVYNADRKIVQEVIEAALPHLAPRENARPEPQCRHGEPEARCASCAACAACDGGCGVCPYAARPEPVVAPLSTEAVDLDAIRTEWLVHCGACDAGLLISCTCSIRDHRPAMLALVNEVERLRGLVPEDDEDTVRVPRRTVARLANAFNDAGGYQQVDPPLAVAISEVTAVLR